MHSPHTRHLNWNDDEQKFKFEMERHATQSINFQDSIHSPSSQLSFRTEWQFRREFPISQPFQLPPVARAHTAENVSFSPTSCAGWMNTKQPQSWSQYPPWTIVECWKNNDMKVIKFYICVIFIVQHNLMCLNSETSVEWVRKARVAAKSRYVRVRVSPETEQ